MARKKERPLYKVVAAYDTETCNVGRGAKTRAYPILYILNDFTDVPLTEYRPDDPRERVWFDRTPDAFMEHLFGIVERGMSEGFVPIVCAYNLTFDMITLMHGLAEGTVLKVNAQSSTNVYTIDVYANEFDAENDGDPLLRFWDTFFLERNGLKAMGETAGVAKATGDWDYGKIRTPETPLTDSELFYAKRDVQVIPAYLRYLLQANEWLTPDMLGVNLLTKTSLVRQMALHTFGPVKTGRRGDGRGRYTMLSQFELLCKSELPKSYDQYALRKACFRGGFTFTAGAYACTDIHGVVSTDVTSMHHTFINGRYIPVGFEWVDARRLGIYAGAVLATTREQVLSRYHQPFNCAFHARFRFRNIRLRGGTCFEKWGIALIPKGKFSPKATGVDYWGDDPASTAAEQSIRDAGWHDQAVNPEFAFGKLYAADECLLHLNELELWAISRAYEWDDMTPIAGEATVKFKRPPDYVTLQSNLLYKRKSDCKLMTKLYDGTPFAGEIPDSIPRALADEMRAGTLNPEFLGNYYNGTVKGMFNSVYGTMAQDVFKAGYEVEDDGEINVDRGTVVNRENFKDMIPNKCRVLYTYGMRIVGGSRVHLVIAMELLYEAFGGRVYATGGDTDSIKCHVPDDVTDQQVEHALDPLLEAGTNAIAVACRHIRAAYPQWASDMRHVGGFEVENAGARYTHHMEYWNKARVSYRDGKYHVTMAGLSRPLNAYHIELIMADLERGGADTETVMRYALGYNVNVSCTASFALQPHRPKTTDVFDREVTDYLGNTVRVTVPEAVALYSADRMLGDTMKPSNRENVEYMRRRGRDVETDLRDVIVSPERVPSVTKGFSMETVLLKGAGHE